MDGDGEPNIFFTMWTVEEINFFFFAVYIIFKALVFI
jgi:hypothetical protein